MRLEANELIFTDTVVFIDYQRQIDSTFILQWFLILHRNVLQISVKKKTKTKTTTQQQQNGFLYSYSNPNLKVSILRTYVLLAVQL